MNARLTALCTVAFAFAFYPCSVAAGDITLDVPRVTQKTIAWCWLAVSEMAVRYYDWDASPRQCRILERLDGLPAGTCCSSPGQCVRTGHLHEIKRVIEHYTGERVRIGGPPRKPSIVAKALGRKHIIIAAIQQPGAQGGHVVVVRGIRKRHGRVQLLVNDPMSRIPQTIDYHTFRAYWTQTVIAYPSPDDESDDGHDDE